MNDKVKSKPVLWSDREHKVARENISDLNFESVANDSSQLQEYPLLLIIDVILTSYLKIHMKLSESNLLSFEKALSYECMIYFVAQ